jgi:hypothetical protein
MMMDFATLLGIRSPTGALLVDAHLVEQIADLMHDTAFFIKEASGRYGLSINHSWSGMVCRTEPQMIGKRYCDVCPDDFGCIPTEQNARVIKRIHGISPMQLIAKTRITAGCRMLHESALRLRRSHWNAPSPITVPLPGSFARSQACRPLSIGG